MNIITFPILQIYERYFGYSSIAVDHGLSSATTISTTFMETLLEFLRQQDFQVYISEMVVFFINGSTSSINAPWPTEISIISLRTAGNVEASNFSVDRNVNSRYANGDLAELIIYNQALTDLEIQTVEGYLAQKWGLTEDLPPQHPYGTKLVNFADSSPLTVLENQPVGTILGDFNTTGFDSNANLTFSLVNGVGDGNNSLFTMETNGTLKTATTFDYESNASTYHIRVQASDESGTNAEGNFTVSLLNEYEPSKSNHSVLGASAMEMIWLEPGTFTMGSPLSEVGRSSSETENNVTFTQGFYLGKYEVTQAEYLNVMQGNPYGLSANPSSHKNTSNPVTNISWQDVEKFCQVLNLREKMREGCQLAGPILCQRKPSGNMPAVPGRKLGFHGEKVKAAVSQIIMVLWDSILQSVSTHPISSVCMICMEM